MSHAKSPQYELLTEKEAAVFLRSSVSKLQKDRIKGMGVPFIKNGKSIRYRLTDLIAYIERNTFQSTCAASMKFALHENYSVTNTCLKITGKNGGLGRDPVYRVGKRPPDTNPVKKKYDKCPV